MGKRGAELCSPLAEPPGWGYTTVHFPGAGKVGKVFQETCELRAVATECLDRGRYDFEALGGWVMRRLLSVGGVVRGASLVALGEGMADGEIHEEAGLAQEAPGIDVDLWRGRCRGGKFRHDLLPAGLVASLLGRMEYDIAATTMSCIQCTTDFAHAGMHAKWVEGLRTLLAGFALTGLGAVGTEARCKYR